MLIWTSNHFCVFVFPTEVAILKVETAVALVWLQSPKGRTVDTGKGKQQDARPSPICYPTVTWCLLLGFEDSLNGQQVLTAYAKGSSSCVCTFHSTHLLQSTKWHGSRGQQQDHFLGVIPLSAHTRSINARSSSREVRIRVPTFYGSLF